MWKATAGQSVKMAVNDETDDWETDPDFEVTILTSTALFSLLAPDTKPFLLISRTMYQRRSSAGGLRRWRAQDIKNTSSEEADHFFSPLLNAAWKALKYFLNVWPQLSQYPPAAWDSVNGAHLPEAEGAGDHAQSLTWVRRKIWIAGRPHGQGESSTN